LPTPECVRNALTCSHGYSPVLPSPARIRRAPLR
jgi:hypothetical protein